MLSKNRLIIFPLLIVFSWLCGFLMLSASYQITSDNLLKNLESSIATFQKEGHYPLAGYVSKATLDNYTDALMLLTSSNNSAFSIRKVLLNPHERVRQGKDDLDPYWSLVKRNEIANAKFSQRDYPRYWHGYVIVLRPLLTFLNYDQIRNFLLVTILSLFCTVIFALSRLNLKTFILPFILFFISLSPIAIVKSLQYSSVIILSLFFSICILNNTRRNKIHYSYIFLFSGILTSFFDFLTCPILSLGIPLLFLLISLKNISWKLCCKITLISCASWFFGYIGMWAGKWVLASLLTNENVIKDAFNAILYRSSLTGPEGEGVISFYEVIKKNFLTFNFVSHNLFFGTLLLFCLIFIFSLKSKCKFLLTSSKKYLLLLLLPFCWYFIASNHAYIHNWFTNRNFSIILFALLCMIADWIRRCIFAKIK